MHDAASSDKPRAYGLWLAALAVLAGFVVVLILEHVSGRGVAADTAVSTALLVAGRAAIGPHRRAVSSRRSAPLVAIVGCDGSGKSTVGEALVTWMRDSGPAEQCHLGKQSGNIGRAIARWPVLGRRADRAIESKVKAAGSGRGPGPFAALTIYAFSLRRLRRFRRMLAMRRRGVAILADRFPQLSVPAGIDGPGFAKVRQRGALTILLARRERRHYEWMTEHRPDLVIRLNVDLATAMRRKPDHRPAALGNKIADIPRLTFDGAPIVDIDATLPLAEVLSQARRAIAPILAAYRMAEARAA